MSEFKKGDRVWCVVHGHGVVSDIGDDMCVYPVDVKFDGDSEEYTLGGRMFGSLTDTLFHEEMMPVPVSALPKPEDYATVDIESLEEIDDINQLGGPAFPQYSMSIPYPLKGMTLLDYFAGQAVQPIVGAYTSAEHGFMVSDLKMAEMAVGVAAAMVNELEKVKNAAKTSKEKQG